MLNIFSCLFWGKKCLFWSSAHFLIGWFVFFILSYMNCLYILEINTLSTASFANIFLHSEDCLFILFMVSFTVQKLLCLVRSNLFIFVFYFHYSKKILKSLIWLISTFNRGEWDLESLTSGLPNLHRIRERAHVSQTRVQPAFHHPVSYRNPVPMCYTVPISAQAAILQVLWADPPNSHQYCNSIDCWILLLVPPLFASAWHVLCPAFFEGLLQHWVSTLSPRVV